MAEVRIERLSWPEVEAALAAGKRTAIVCAAASEQHGPHPPEATDALLGEVIAVRLAEELGDALVAPVIRPACSDHHMAFPGTITISADLLTALLDAYLESLGRHGFRRFVVFSSHGGNFPVLADWAHRRPRPDVIVLSDIEGFLEAMREGMRKHGRDDDYGVHADLMETSEMLAVHPELVHMERAAPGYTKPMVLQDVLDRGMRAISASGVLGNPVGATAEMGESVLERLVGHLAARVRQAGISEARRYTRLTFGEGVASA